MKMTYRQMVKFMNETFTEEQWDSDVTVEDLDNECYPADLSFVGLEHDSLDENHPIICIITDC